MTVKLSVVRCDTKTQPQPHWALTWEDTASLAACRSYRLP